MPIDKFASRPEEKNARPGVNEVPPPQDDQAAFHQAKDTSLASAQSTIQEKFGTPTISGNSQDQTHRIDTPPVANKSLPTAGKESPAYLTEKPTAKEIEYFKNIATPQQIEWVKREINKFAQSPKAAILEAVRKDRIVLLGELHTTPDGMKTVLECMMADLKAAGVTHWAEEIRQKDQGLLDGLAKGDKKAIEDFRKIYQVDDDWIAMVQAAAAKDIKVVAVDYNYDDNVDVGAPDIMRLRDKAMTNNMGAIVEADDNARVIFFGGKHHVELNDKDSYLSTAEQLASRGKENGYTVATFASYAEDPPEFGVENAGTVLAKTATHAISVRTKETEVLKILPVNLQIEGQGILNTASLSGSMGKHDYVLFMPVETALKVAEEKYGKDSPQMIHRLKDLALAYRHHSDDRGEQGPALLDRALNLAQRHFGKDSTQAAECHRELGTYYAGDKEASSQQHLETVLSIFQQNANGKFTPELSRSYMDLIDFHKEDTPYEAMKYFNLASSYLKNDIEKIKSEHWLGTGSLLMKSHNKKNKTTAKVDLPPVARDFVKNYAALLKQSGKTEEAKRIIDRFSK